MPRVTRIARGTGRAHIITATISLIAERGVGAVRLRLIAQRSGVSLGSTTYHFADRDELITAALSEHATTVTASTTIGGDRDAAAAAVRRVYTDRTAALVCAETRLHATRDTRAAQLADHIHHTLTAAIATARDRDEQAGELVAVLNTAAVDTARAHTDAASYADAMGERVDAALAS